MKRKTLTLLFALLYFILFAGAVLLFFYFFPNREAIQAWLKGHDFWGVFLYLGLITLSVVFTPLNYSMIGLLGGFLYGTPSAFFLLWMGRVVGNGINFTIARKLGRRILRYFIKEEKIHAYDLLLESEKAALIYFILCFLPFLPGDYGGYLLGLSAMKKRVFLPITIVANIGSSFSLAYMGSGEAFTDPLFLSIFIVIFISGLMWIHKEKKKFHLL